MRRQEIIHLANNLKEEHESTNPFKICREMSIPVSFKKYHESYRAFMARPFNVPTITINSRYTETSQKVLCAHELGHALLHINSHHYDDTSESEFEANLFAVALLFNQEDFNFKFSNMNNYMLKSILDYNLRLK